MATAAKDSNKVRFGLSNVWVGTYTVDDKGTVTMGVPMHQRGAVKMSIEPSTNQDDFFADNIKYYSKYTFSGFTGSLETAKYDTTFKTQFLGYKELTGGGIAKISNAVKPNVYIMFEANGDVKKRRGILFNVALGEITQEYATTEDKTDVATESIDITVTGDEATGICSASFEEGEANYNKVCSSTVPPTPSVLVSATGE